MENYPDYTFNNVRIEDYDYSTEILENIKIVNSKFENVNFKDADLTGLTFHKCIFENCDFTSARLEFGKVDETVFKKCNFSLTSFTKTEVSNSEFRGSNCSYTLFKNAKFKKNTFQNSVIKNANIDDTDFDAYFEDSIVTDTVSENGFIVLTAVNSMLKNLTFKNQRRFSLLGSKLELDNISITDDSNIGVIEIKDTIISKLNLEKSRINKLELEKSQLIHSNLFYLDFDDVKLSDCYFNNVAFELLTVSRMKIEKTNVAMCGLLNCIIKFLEYQDENNITNNTMKKLAIENSIGIEILYLKNSSNSRQNIMIIPSKNLIYNDEDGQPIKSNDFLKYKETYKNLTALFV